MDEAKRKAEIEERDFDDLVQWLDHADQVLDIVKQPIHDRNTEFKVSKMILKMN